MSDGEDYVKADHLSDEGESCNRRKNQRSVSPHRRHSSSRHSGNRDLSPAPRHSRSRSRDGSPRPRSRSPSLRRSRSRSRRRSYTRSRSRSRSRRYRSRHYDSRSRSRSPRRRRYSRSRRSRSVSPMSNRRRHVGNRENPQPTRCLGVFGLSLYTQERDLRDVFSKYGAVEEVQVVYDAQTGRSRGFSFVYFENVDDAQMAKERCNGLEVDGRRIRVDYSITQRAHTPTPGIYMGKPTGGSSGRRTPSPSGPSYQSGGGRYSGGYSGGGGSYRRSPSPYYSSRRSRYSRSRSRSYSPRRY